MKSSKPKKQRKQFHAMPLHQRQKTMAVHLSAELKKKMGKRAIVVRKGDTVKVLRGSNTGKKGKIARVDYKKRVLTIEGLVRKKSDGTDVAIPFQPSNLAIITLEDTKIRVKKKGGA